MWFQGFSFSRLKYLQKVGVKEAYPGFPPRSIHATIPERSGPQKPWDRENAGMNKHVDGFTSKPLRTEKAGVLPVPRLLRP